MKQNRDFRPLAVEVPTWLQTWRQPVPRSKRWAMHTIRRTPRVCTKHKETRDAPQRETSTRYI